tara:strand:+ start:468 stop:662 length:195 start_codon:yes stop_codon:yes gene_type:complete
MREYIAHKELIERLKTIKEVLKEHENAATPDLLDALDSVMEVFKPAKGVMESIDKIFQDMLGGK